MNSFINYWLIKSQALTFCVNSTDTWSQYPIKLPCCSLESQVWFRSTVSRINTKSEGLRLDQPVIDKAVHLLWWRVFATFEKNLREGREEFSGRWLQWWCIGLAKKIVQVFPLHSLREKKQVNFLANPIQVFSYPKQIHSWNIKNNTEDSMEFMILFGYRKAMKGFSSVLPLRAHI